MSFSYRNWIGLAIVMCAMLTIILVSDISVSRAQTPTAVAYSCPPGTKIYGWAWSPNIGWISFNSESGGGGPYCVSIDTGGYLNGWAWSSNIGWIKFGGLDNFPNVPDAATGNARVDAGRIIGWARACAGSANGLCTNSAPRTDGWDGWIEVGNNTRYLSYSGGNITGNMWGSDVVGWAEVNASTTLAVAAAKCTISNTGNQTTGFNVKWVGTSVSSCTGLATPTTGSAYSFPVANVSDQMTVNPTVTTNYKLTCTPIQTGSPVTCNTTLTYVPPVTPPGGGCEPNCPTGDPDSAALQMWLGNSELNSYVETKTGKSVDIKYKAASSGDTFSSCTGTLRDSSNTSPDNQTYSSEDIGSVSSQSEVITKAFTTPGDYRYTMTCLSDEDQKVYIGKAKLNAAGTQTQSYLRIRVKEATIEEE